MILWVAFWGVLYHFMHRNSNLAVSSDHQLTPSSNNDNRVSLLFCVLLMGYIVFWAAVRSGVADTYTYIEIFKKYPDNLSEISKYWGVGGKAPGFDTFTIIVKSLFSNDYHIWLAIIAIMSGIPVMITLRNKSVNYIYSVFLFLTMLHFSWLFNGMRQFLVVTILFYCSKLIEKKKTLSFIIVTALLSTFHLSALILIPIYFIIQGKPFGKRIILFIFLILVAVLLVDQFVVSLDSLLEDTAYAGTATQIAEDNGVNPLRFLVMLVPPALAFIKRKELEQINNHYINICINMSVICAGLYFLGMFSSGVFIGRLPIYFELYNLILLPFLIEKCFELKWKQLLYILSSIGYLLFYVLTFNWHYISDITGFIDSNVWWFKL